jgi:AraC-like DNA-binding protein
MNGNLNIFFEVVQSNSKINNLDLGNLTIKNVQIVDFKNNSAFFCAVSDSRDNLKALNYELAEYLNDAYLFIYLNTSSSKSLLLGVSEKWIQNYLSANFNLFEKKFVDIINNVLKNFSLSHSVVTSRHLLFQKHFTSTDFTSLLLESYCTQFIHYFLVCIDAELKNENHSNFKFSDYKKIKEIEHEITKNLSKSSPSIKEMAEKAGMSVTKFKILFRETFGETPHQYIIDKKLFFAKELLQTGQYSITEVSYKIGFTYPSGFTRLFKSKFQFPPSVIYTNKNAILELAND